MSEEITFPSLYAYLDACHIRLDEFGCFVALYPDRTTIFWCPMNANGTPDRWDAHMNWGEVTAPEPGFVETINQLYGTSFQHAKFAGR